MTENKKSKRPAYYWIVILLLAVVFTWLFLPYAINWWLPDDQNRKAFLDASASVEALFSAVAFAGLVITVLMQRKELELQYDELHLTRMELKEQSKQLGIQNETLRTASLHEVLLGVLRDYRSAEMLQAVTSLWAFQKNHGEKFVAKYVSDWKQDEHDIPLKPTKEQLSAIQASIHYKRRLVASFYNTVAGMHELKIIPSNVLFTYWSRDDLKIIPEIIIPLSKAISRELQQAEETDNTRRLTKLFEDCKSEGG